MDVASPTALFDELKDGIIFAKLINIVDPGTVDERALNLGGKGGKALSKFQVWRPAQHTWHTLTHSHTHARARARARARR